MKERTYIISKQQQYVQSVDLKAGRYTINYSIRTPNTSHRFAFLKKSGGWQEFEMQNLTPGKWHRKDEAKLSFYLLEDVVAFNLCTSPVSVSSPVMIQKLMLEEGMNASTAKPNELDLLESIEDLFDMEHIFKPEKTLVQPETPESLQQDDYTPEGWDDDPMTATKNFPYVWHSFRQRIGDVWGAFYPPTLYSSYSKPGEDVKMIEIRGGTSLKNPDKTGGVSSTTLTVVKHGFESSIKWEWLYQGSWQATSWSSTTLVVDYSEHASLFVNDVATLRCVSTVNPEVFTVVSITAVWDGENGGDGITLLQSNQSHSFAGGVSAALPGSVTNTILAYKGGQKLTPTVNVDPFYLPTGMTRSVNGSEVTFTVTSQMNRPSGVIPIDVLVDGKTITVHFSYSIAFKGADGLTKDIRLEASSQVMQKLKDGTYMPSSVTVTATAVNTTVTTWTYSIDGVGFSYTPPAGVSRSGNVVTINPATATQSMYVIRASDGTISDILTVIRIEVPKDGEDGHSPYIGENGNWWVWDSAQNKYVDSGDSAHGDDGKSPEIRDGYWWVWDGTKWYNTGVKAEGKDGVTPVVTQLIPSVILIGKSAGGDPQPNTFTVRHLDGSGNAVNVWLAAFGSHDGDVWYPIEYAEYASFIVVNVAAYPYKYFVVRSYSPLSFPAPDEVYWNTPYLLSVSVGMYEDGKDGLPGISGQVPVQKEWVAGDRHRNSDEIVDYIYVRGSNSKTSYWYQLINKTDTEGIIAGGAPTGGGIPAGYKAVTWMPALSVKTLIAEEANLANLIFKEGKLISIKGNTFAGEEINYGEYTEYNFASTTTQPGVDSASWLEIPPSTIRWIRYKKNTGSSWTVKQGGTGTGQWTMQFATAPEGETWYSSYSANRFWARVKVGGESDYGKPFRFTPAGGYDFIPNIVIDGENGEITSRKMTAGNSGIQGTNNELPAFWAGGTYAQAIDGLAKAIIKHDGKSKLSDTEITGVINALSGKVGVLTIEESGRVVLTDPDTHAVRIVFSESDIPLIADLVSGANDGGSASNAAKSNITVGYQLPNAITVGKNNSSIAFSASTFSVNANISNMMDYITVNVYLRKNGVNFTMIKSVQLYGPGSKSENTSITYGVDGVGTGTYDVFIEITKTNALDTVSSYISASTLSWTYTQAGIRYFQFGVNGMMAFFSDNHWYFTETGGLDLKGETNMPGVLAAGRSTSGGVQSNVWGAKSSVINITPITGGFRVPLSNMKHSNYVVQITPHTATTFRVDPTKNTKTSFEVYGTGGFDYVVIGNNY